jgi:hypothetical protein
MSKEERLKPMKSEDVETALDEQCERVVTSAAWLFDAENDSAPARAFVQVSIGFEALYGNAEAKPNLTETLCDRVSYALGTTLGDRESLSRMFEKFYLRRSAIVHTGLARLDEDDGVLLRWAKETLRKALQSELAIIERTHDQVVQRRRRLLAEAMRPEIGS